MDSTTPEYDRILHTSQKCTKKLENVSLKLLEARITTAMHCDMLLQLGLDLPMEENQNEDDETKVTKHASVVGDGDAAMSTADA